MGPEPDGGILENVATMPSPPSMGSEDKTSDNDVAMAVMLSEGKEIVSEALDTKLPEGCPALPIPVVRRISTCARALRPDHGQQHDPLGQVTTRRLVRDRWYYTLVRPLPLDSDSLGSSTVEATDQDEESLTHLQAGLLVRRFNIESRNRRAILKARIQRAWRARNHLQEAALVAHNTIPRVVQQEVVKDATSSDGNLGLLIQSVNVTPYEAVYGMYPPVNGADLLPDVHHALDAFLAQRLDSGGILNLDVVFDEFLAQQLNQFELVLIEN